MKSEAKVLNRPCILSATIPSLLAIQLLRGVVFIFVAIDMAE
jgi:hypothetical protein